MTDDEVQALAKKLGDLKSHALEISNPRKRDVKTQTSMSAGDVESLEGNLAAAQQEVTQLRQTAEQAQQKAQSADLENQLLKAQVETLKAQAEVNRLELERAKLSALTAAQQNPNVRQPEFKTTTDPDTFQLGMLLFLKTYPNAEAFHVLSQAFQDNPDASRWLLEVSETRPDAYGLPWEPDLKEMFQKRFNPKTDGFRPAKKPRLNDGAGPSGSQPKAVDPTTKMNTFAQHLGRHLTKAEHDQYKTQGLCFRCGQKGHKGSQCRKFPMSGTAVNQMEVDAKPDDA